MISLLTDSEANRFMGGRCAKREDAERLFPRMSGVYRGEFLPRRFEIWAIESEGEYAGHFELKQSEHTNGNELETDYMLKKEHRGRGLIPEILRMIVSYAAETKNIVIATVSRHNSGTMRALEKAGILKTEIPGEPAEGDFKIYLENE